MSQNEVHIVNQPNGHHMSVDCWCEPVSIKWMTNFLGIRVLVVEHNDLTMDHHSLVLARRDEQRTLPFVGSFVDLPINRGPEAPWITRVLSSASQPKQLPPPSPES